MTYVVWPHDAHRRRDMGAKAATLSTLQDLGWSIPDWFVLARSACEDSTEGAEVGETRLSPSAAVRDALARALTILCPDGAPVAVRSSAMEEDGATSSFAGQYMSRLWVAPGDVASAVADVWCSAHQAGVRAYRERRGVAGRVAAPAVLIQRMVDADRAGIAFGVDPVTGRSQTVVTAVRGVAAELAAGAVTGDLYRVQSNGEILADPANDGSSGMTEPEIDRVARLTSQVGERLGGPQDVEWAISGDSLFLLQARPVTGLPAPDGERCIWDNSNIIESYSGVTTPLTFSFARRAYEEVYRQFCSIMGVRRRQVEAHGQVFANMLGLINGRVYYHLLNWYRVLALLPGFTVNRRFMEQMMGVKEELPKDVVERLRAASTAQRIGDAIGLAGSVGALAVNLAGLGRRIARFQRRLDRVLTPPDPPLEGRSLEALVAYYRTLEDQLLRNWDAPLVNDFFAMIFFGVLGRLTAGWCGDERGELRNGLLGNDGAIVSTEPVRWVRSMAERLPDDAAIALFSVGPRSEVERWLAGDPALGRDMAAYLAAFGDRCIGELKLETSTLSDDPTPLYRAIGRATEAVRRDESPARMAEASRTAAERTVADRIGRRPGRRLLFRWVLKHARLRLRYRENLRFERTRVFGRARRIFVEVGRRLAEVGRLEAPEDVFYLEVEEILALAEAGRMARDLRPIVRARRREFEAFHAPDSEPPARFETRGTTTRYAPARRPTVRGDDDADERSGLGCSAGVVRGRVRVVDDPEGARLERDEVLVARHTDPGWILLLSSAVAVVVERGSLLSHSAIVSRELGIPAVVGVPDATTWLRTGDEVEIDGAAGVVRRLDTPRSG